MSSLISRLSKSFLNIRRPLHSTAMQRLKVDDDGDIGQFRTTVTILNHDQEQGVFIDSYSTLGFKLTSGVHIVGPCALFPRSLLHWNVGGVHDINEDSLSLFTMLDPKIDILVLGVGEPENVQKIDFKIIQYMRSKRINVELLPTNQALSVFNFLNAEKRYVAGAFIPQSVPDTAEDSFL